MASLQQEQLLKPDSQVLQNFVAKTCIVYMLCVSVDNQMALLSLTINLQFKIGNIGSECLL